MGRFLRITIVVLLVMSVWAVLVAPDYDLVPTTLQGKLAATMLLCAALAAVSFEAAEVLRRLPRWNPPPDSGLSLLELTCSRLC